MIWKKKPCTIDARKRIWRETERDRERAVLKTRKTGSVPGRRGQMGSLHLQYNVKRVEAQQETEWVKTWRVRPTEATEDSRIITEDSRIMNFTLLVLVRFNIPHRRWRSFGSYRMTRGIDW